MENFYHGSFVRNLGYLKPFSKAHNTIKKSVVYLTPNIHLAQFYIWNRPYKFVTFEENDEGQVVFTEWFENQLYDFYDNVCGSVYVCSNNNASIYPTHIKSVYNSDTAVKVDKEITVKNVYESILDQQEKGNIIIKRYDRLLEDERKTISSNVIRAIHMQHLLCPNFSGYNQDFEAFVKRHFPQEWENASQMSEAEIKNTINSWKKSIQ